jgi:hypothetical protein
MTTDHEETTRLGNTFDGLGAFELMVFSEDDGELVERVYNLQTCDEDDLLDLLQFHLNQAKYHDAKGKALYEHCKKRFGENFFKDEDEAN